MMKLKKAVGYVRISAIEEAETGAMQEQIREIRHHAEYHGYELVDIYSDLDIGISQQRPGLLKLMSGAEHGRFDTVITADPSRLFRVKEMLERYELRLKHQLGVELVFLDRRPKESLNL